MKVHVWNALLALFCLPAAVPWTVSQTPPVISLMGLNLSTEIRCTTSLPQPIGLYLRGHFNDDVEILFLSLKNRAAVRTTVFTGFAGRVDVTPVRDPGQMEEGKEDYGFTLRLSLMGLKDTDVYYCSWKYLRGTELESLRSNGTVVIVRDGDPWEQCKGLSVGVISALTAFSAVFLLVLVTIGALIWRCTMMRRHYRVRRDVSRSRPRKHPVTG